MTRRMQLGQGRDAQLTACVLLAMAIFSSERCPYGKEQIIENLEIRGIVIPSQPRRVFRSVLVPYPFQGPRVLRSCDAAGS